AVDRDAPAFGRVRAGDLIVEVDGKRVRTPGESRGLIGRREPGDRVRITLRRDGKLERLELRTIADPEQGRRPIIGVVPEQAAKITLPVDVEINTGRIGGPSAGLAFALDIVEELGRDVDRGRKIAVTGQLELDGAVLPIGGVRQKVFGAQKADVDIFVVPAGENAREARRYAKGLRIVPVNSFQQALQKLATLPGAPRE
ncbi:MAG: PDZ domain-containing protein, partial [Actinomycetota bacterium]|nr:PDZ domain-containing protein [Actinomycetota bacterium]